jgi:universal stress protein A
MNTYQHILVAVDLSTTSQQVALKAQELATSNQAKLSVIHVVEVMPMIDINYDMASSPFTVELNQILISNAEKNLGFFISELKIDPQQKFLEQGDPREIIRVAEENQADLIILGSHGRHGLALLLGSTANAVLHHAKCDVLAVRLVEE